MTYVSDLDTPLLKLSSSDHWTLRDACQGVQVFGGIGAGKTSGSGKHLASAYLRAGMGGLVLAAKPEEVELWLRYAQENGRANSVMVFDERRGNYNFLTSELARQGMRGIGSVIECLMRILEAARLAGPSPGRTGDQFWDDATKQLLRNSIPVLYSATATVSIPDIIRFINSAPTSLQQLQSEEWQSRSFMFATLLASRKSPRIRMEPSDFEKTASYWRDEFAQLDPKTRGNIAISVSTTLDRFNRGRLQQAFCRQTTLVPELTFHGAIIIMNMPALTWNEDGVIGQQLFKYMWQRAVLSRNSLEPRQRDRPVFLWADESQYFVNSYDAEFQSTCRSSKACTVFLTQSLPTYYAKIGGENPQHRTDMLLANFLTKIFHNNGCPVTNRFASDSIGRTLQRRRSYNEGESQGYSEGMNHGGNTSWGSNTGGGVSGGGMNGQASSSSNWGSSSGGGKSWGRSRGTNTGTSTTDGWSEVLENEIEPGEFASLLKTGGPANAGEVDAIWFQAGKQFRDSGRNYLFTRFSQK